MEMTPKYLYVSRGDILDIFEYRTNYLYQDKIKREKWFLQREFEGIGYPQIIRKIPAYIYRDPDDQYQQTGIHPLHALPFKKSHNMMLRALYIEIYTHEYLPSAYLVCVRGYWKEGQKNPEFIIDEKLKRSCIYRQDHFDYLGIGSQVLYLTGRYKYGTYCSFTPPPLVDLSDLSKQEREVVEKFANIYINNPHRYITRESRSKYMKWLRQPHILRSAILHDLYNKLIKREKLYWNCLKNQNRWAPGKPDYDNIMTPNKEGLSPGKIQFILKKAEQLGCKIERKDLDVEVKNFFNLPKTPKLGLEDIIIKFNNKVVARFVLHQGVSRFASFHTKDVWKCLLDINYSIFDFIDINSIKPFLSKERNLEYIEQLSRVLPGKQWWRLKQKIIKQKEKQQKKKRKLSLSQMLELEQQIIEFLNTFTFSMLNGQLAAFEACRKKFPEVDPKIITSIMIKHFFS